MDTSNIIELDPVQSGSGLPRKRKLSSEASPANAVKITEPHTPPHFSPPQDDVPATRTSTSSPPAPCSAFTGQPNKMRRISGTRRVKIHSPPSSVHTDPGEADTTTRWPSPVNPDTTAVACLDDDSDDDSKSSFVHDQKPRGLEEIVPIIIPDDSDTDLESLFGPSAPPDADDSDGSLFGDPSTLDEMGAGAPLSPPPESKRLPGVDTPAGMNCELMPHQRIGVEWLLEHERGEDRGSILADDMGLGKTVQAISLMLANPPKEGSRCKTTLIVAPLALLKQWPREIDDKIKPGHKLKVHVFHGEGRKTSIGRLLSHDVVLTNYETIAAEFKIAETKKKGMILLDPDVNFYRIILDEAHLIKNRTTITSQGAFRLKATYRLALSGTPIMNKPEELYSLMCFLKISPYDDWECFNRDIAKYLRHEHLAKSRLGSHALKKIQRLRHRTMLVRSKKDLIEDKPIISLPERTEVVEHCEFDQDELDFYTSLEHKTELEVQRYMKASISGRPNFASILVQLLRLRQACCHPNLLVDYFSEKDEDTDQGAAVSDLDTDFDPDDLDETGSARPKAMAKRKRRTRTKGQMQEYYRQLEEDYVPSAKVRKTLELLARIREEAPREKAIVFSFFTSFLDILVVALRRAGGFRHRRYDGRMSPAAKDAAVADFMDPRSDATILLTSLKSGNAGLNLNLANHVIILEPYWNPFVELQAVDRAHRIGQTRPVTVHRVLVPNTVEDRILALQEEKKKMVELALGTGDAEEMRQQRKEGMVGLTKKDVLKLLRSGQRPPGGASASRRTR